MANKGNRNRNNSNSKGKPRYNNSKQGNKCAPEGRKGVNGGVEKDSADYNNPEWRMYNDILANSVNAFTLNQFVGENVDLEAQDNWSTVAKFRFETIMRVYINPSAGLTWENVDPVNQSALKLFTTLSANNMKTTQYAPQDVMICLLALGEIISGASFIMRALGIVTKTNPRNRNWPTGIISAMGLDADDLYKNYEVYRARYNILAARASAIAFPSSVNYFPTCAALFSDIFIDQPNAMGFAYVTVPYSTWILDEKSDPNGSKLSTTKLVNTGTGMITTMSEVLNTFERMINALLNSATLNYLYSDVLKYYGNDKTKLYTLPMVPSGFAIDPIFSPEFCINLHNAKIIGEPMTKKMTLSPAWNQTLSNDVMSFADTNSIHYAPVFKPDNIIGAVKSILDFEGDNPDLNTRVAALRFMTMAEKASVSILPDGGRNIYVQYNLSDHYVVRIDLLDQRSDPYSAIYTLNSNALLIEGSDKTAPAYMQVQDVFTSACDITQFNGAPLMYFVRDIKADSGPTYYIDGVLGGLGTYTVLDPQSSKAANEVTMLSLFALK